MQPLFGAVALGACVVVILLLAREPSTVPSIFAWQHHCGTECASTLGEERMNFIDSQGCVTLDTQVGMKRNKNQVEWDAAIKDKRDSLHCDSVSDQQNTADYRPIFDWQNRCGQKCTSVLGSEQLADIDDLSCSAMQEVALPIARNPRSARDYAQNKEWYDEWSKAVLDKADAMPC